MPIVSNNRDLKKLIVAHGDDQFAELVRVLFINDGRDDPTRQNTEFMAPLRTDRSRSNNMSGGPSKHLKVSVVAHRARLSLDPATYQGPKMKKGDIVMALERDGEPRFEVVSIDDRSLTRHIVNLNLK